MAMKKPPPIKLKKSTQGTYTARAKANGNTVQQQATKDLAPGAKVTATTRKRAQFAKNFAGKKGK